MSPLPLGLNFELLILIVASWPTWSKPCPWAWWQTVGRGFAECARALLTLKGEYPAWFCFIPEMRRDTAPQTWGHDIEVPFISWKTITITSQFYFFNTLWQSRPITHQSTINLSMSKLEKLFANPCCVFRPANGCTTNPLKYNYIRIIESRWHIGMLSGSGAGAQEFKPRQGRFIYLCWPFNHLSPRLYTC